MYIMTTLKTSPLNEALEYIESWLKFNFENSSIPGMQVAIGFEDDIVFSRAYGYADISKKEKMTPKKGGRSSKNALDPSIHPR